MTTASNMLPENSVTVIRGSSKTLELTVTDANGTAVDLTDARVVMTVKCKVEDRDWLIQKTTDDALQAVITAPRSGIARIFLVPADTQNLDPKQYVFDVWTVLSNGRRFAVVQPSVFEVTAGVTVLAL